MEDNSLKVILTKKYGVLWDV
uniref:Uncharacterized protein n=1 Tax=Rhizophora mucronata TaxID=61149 RepID=A0A2P2NM18_RHIMU